MEIHHDERKNMNAESHYTDLSIPIAELSVGDQIWDTYSGEYWEVLSIDNDHKTTSVEVLAEDESDFLHFFNYATVDILRPLCQRHGGRWGDDETCEDCTEENGNPKAL